MCIDALAWDAHPHWLLVAAGNRDEFHARPSAPLARWEGSDSGILAGRDLQAGGTWLGVSEAGRFALVTNYRAPGYPRPDRASRGKLVIDLLAGREPEPGGAYNPFNLLLAGPQGAALWSNHPGDSHVPLAPGVHGLSNGDFAHPWPKTRCLIAALRAWLASEAQAMTPLFAALRLDTPPPAMPGEDGPEAPYSPVFIRNPVYGTRCSTVVAVARDGTGTIVERRFDAEGEPTGESALPFHWPVG
jgi:uncharacterized protein with NRDE domain